MVKRSSKLETTGRDIGMTNTYKKNVYAIDLFCGAGGLTKGLEKAGLNVKLGIDIDPECEYPYSANTSAEFLRASVNSVDGGKLEQYYRKNGIRLLAGCAPCQTFSSYNKKATSKDERWWLLLEFARLIREIHPELVAMENVPGLADQDVFGTFIDELKSQDYEISHSVVECIEYGIPQNRKRLVLLASKYGPISLLTPEEFGARRRTVRMAIGNLPPLAAGEIDSRDPLHQSASLSPLNRKRMRASKAGGSWKDWDEKLICDCHRRESGESYPSVYGRMSWDEPSPTVTTQFYGFGNGRFGHPEQDRALSLREGAILQSFPDDYRFVPPGETIKKTTIGRLIGNAVPVRLGEVIGKSILEHVWSYGNNARRIS
jgi:DNA (cytosine-5)-methyltransferase 1